MPTTEQDKPAAKPRQRSRKTDNNKTDQKTDQRNQKAEQTAEAKPDFETVADPVESPVIESPVIESLVEAPTEAAPAVFAEPAAFAETPADTALSGEVLPPEVREPVPQTLALAAIAQAYDDYSRKSWHAGRFLVERLIAVRSFDEAIEIQGEFAKQAYANFATQSQKICVLYGEWAQQLFRPLDKFAPRWTRIGR